jgi:hypothetical protein
MTYTMIKRKKFSLREQIKWVIVGNILLEVVIEVVLELII